MAVLEASPTPIKIVREDGLVVYRNGAVAKLAAMFPGRPPIEAGMNLSDWHPEAYANERVDLLRRLAIAEQDAVVRNIMQGEQMITHIRILPRREGEWMRTFLVMYEHMQGPADAASFPDEVFYDAKHQYLGPLETLSRREIEVLALIGEGLTAAQIAERIHRSEETVNTHRGSLLRKLNCQNAAQLAIVSYRAGLKYTDGQHFQS